MSLYDYIEKLFQQTGNIDKRLSAVEIKLKDIESSYKIAGGEGK